jgi:hypothetical protein
MWELERTGPGIGQSMDRGDIKSLKKERIGGYQQMNKQV